MNPAAQPPTLLVDLGNSRLKWAWLEAGLPGKAAALSHRAQELDRQLDAGWGAMPVPARVLLSSVAASQRTEQFRAWVRGRWGLQVEQVFSRARALGVTNAYANPRHLGVDRWLALVAVRRRFPGPACIVDCGSAITIDGLADPAGAIGYGGLYACVALVERLAARIEGECARVPEIILSGGDGARLQPLLVPASRYEQDLVLSGLAAIAGEYET